ncbi:PREDICTED: uncharacterized protein LOC104593495 [Nelumbo nucifera]|uniref:Uncharacterized protein LOC104593495 n=1 Tax=Nelumbo nucifera TaxID=4432 RepID=A0A1U7ZDG9_NELNU|nr:PREDICTED: uncharacterized protein LOC104593495 [Nelumbo nucifera]
METLSRVLSFNSINSAELTNSIPFLIRRTPPFHRVRTRSSRTSGTLAFRSSLRDNEIAREEDVLQIFLKERQLSGDFISKASDILLRSDILNFVDSDSSVLEENPQQLDKVMENKNDGGFLKLTKTQEWVSGDTSAPINKKAMAKDLRNDSERRKKLNLLRYEALKRELVVLTSGIGIACSGYCLVVFSVQAAVSYAAGVLLSCLYLQLLYHHTDNMSKENIPQIFMQKKSKKIGIRSEDLKNLLERSIKGSAIALSSPRLMIPVAIYGFWTLSQHLTNDFFDFQLVPAMFGMFAYKAAALVQVYRDNEDLRFIFPESEDGSSDFE